MFQPPDHCRGKGIKDVADDHTYGVGFLHDETSGNSVGMVAQLFNDGVDFFF
jgi:hypothetical protein